MHAALRDPVGEQRACDDAEPTRGEQEPGAAVTGVERLVGEHREKAHDAGSEAEARFRPEQREHLRSVPRIADRIRGVRERTHANRPVGFGAGLAHGPAHAEDEGSRHGEAHRVGDEGRVATEEHGEPCAECRTDRQHRSPRRRHERCREREVLLVDEVRQTRRSMPARRTLRARRWCPARRRPSTLDRSRRAGSRAPRRIGWTRRARAPCGGRSGRRRCRRGESRRTPGGSPRRTPSPRGTPSR